jgi:solute:Na+ symporter, SSS family
VHSLDYIVFGTYMLGIVAVGFGLMKTNRRPDDFYVGGRKMKSGHIGFSIAATDVGGGFSIGLGGLGFTMGLSGSWLLFSGLIGAWLAGVLIIPKLTSMPESKTMSTYPDFLRLRFGAKPAMLAALISGIGYLAFTGGQVLAGAKLASQTLFTHAPFGLDALQFSLWLLAGITIVYTVAGGLKAVIYTDSIQWAVLLGGLLLGAVPMAYLAVGGWEGLAQNLPAGHLNLFNISLSTFANWMITIIPIWFIAMTLYQRAFACGSTKEAKKAWFIAGLLEWPIMSFTGVFLGMCARMLFPEADAESGMALVIRDVLPMGIAGLVIAAYFSAIMSTADSCLLASSGHFVSDILERIQPKWGKQEFYKRIRMSRIATATLGFIAVLIASRYQSVLDIILQAYSFMVSGLTIPTLAAFFWKKASSYGALIAMIGGGTFSILFQNKIISPPSVLQQTGLDPTFWCLAISAILLVAFSYILPDTKSRELHE